MLHMLTSTIKLAYIPAPWILWDIYIYIIYIYIYYLACLAEIFCCNARFQIAGKTDRPYGSMACKTPEPLVARVVVRIEKQETHMTYSI